jgi:hypothetical protein
MYGKLTFLKMFKPHVSTISPEFPADDNKSNSTHLGVKGGELNLKYINWPKQTFHYRQYATCLASPAKRRTKKWN